MQHSDILTCGKCGPIEESKNISSSYANYHTMTSSQLRPSIFPGNFLIIDHIEDQSLSCYCY